jgi:hypothetical protein
MAGGKVDDDIASGAKEGTTVIRRVIREVGGRTTFPVLTKSNSLDWVMMMRVMLKVCSLCVIVEKGGVNPQEDMMALDALVSAVPPKMVATVVDKRSVKETWDAIATMRISDDQVKKAVA